MVIILSGVQGSGKTYFLKNQLRQHLGLPDMLSVISCSADDFFLDVEGKYNFDPSKLPQAHAACLKKFVEACQTKQPVNRWVIVVDNTNSTVAEIAPYYAIAETYGHDVEIVTIECRLELAVVRQTHGVPGYAIGIVAERIRSRVLPPWWKQRSIQPDAV